MCRHHLGQYSPWTKICVLSAVINIWGTSTSQHDPFISNIIASHCSIPFSRLALSQIFLKLCQSRFVNVLKVCYIFLLSIIIFARDVLVKKNIIPLRVKKILFWEVANYRQLLHNFRAKWAVICPEGTWSSHEGKWPHVSWKKLKCKNRWQLGCLGSINLSPLCINFKWNGWESKAFSQECVKSKFTTKVATVRCSQRAW